MRNIVIAKRIKKPRHVVSYNREQLKKQGILGDDRLIINYEALGYKEALVYLKIFQYSEIKDKIVKFISNHPNFKWGADAFPNYNVRAILVFKTIEELEKIIDEIEKLCQGKLLKKEVLLGRGLLKQEMFVTKDVVEPMIKPKQITLDSKEKKLFEALFQKPGETLLELSKKSGMSIESVRQKIDKFKRTGFIERFSARVAVGKLDVNFWGVLCLRVNNLDKHLNKFRTLLYSNKGYGMTRRLFGSWNVEIGITVTSYIELIEMIKQMEKLFGTDLEDFEITNQLIRFMDHKIPSVVFSK
jgi:DNA-binding Lrp family transcriptional regulator